LFGTLGVCHDFLGRKEEKSFGKLDVLPFTMTYVMKNMTYVILIYFFA
jgi:hypothetical protein